MALVGRDPVLETLEGEERREEKGKMLRRMNASRYDHVTFGELNIAWPKLLASYVIEAVGRSSSFLKLHDVIISLNPLKFVHALSIRISQLDQRNRLYALFGFGVLHGPLTPWTLSGLRDKDWLSFLLYSKLIHQRG